MEQRLFLNGLNWIRALRLTACDLPLRRVGILPLLAFGSVLGLTSCIPYSILQRQEFQDKEKVAITCEWINKGFHFKRLVFCESSQQYMVLYHKEPWLTYEKAHFQRYLSYLLKNYFKESNLNLSRFHFSKVSVWIHAESLAPENVSYYVQIADLLVHLPLYPKQWKIDRQNTYYFVEKEPHFPYATHRKLAVVDIELNTESDFPKFHSLMRSEFPKARVVSTTFPLVRIKVPVFQEVSYSSKIFYHPEGSKLIKDIRPVSAPGIKIGDLKRMSQFDLYLTSEEKNIKAK
ncbi:MAG: hypothetical protein HRU09_10790 [Oligoflexales bacterium]|nr:hypothetical protein [Oligoflexales bacterium]